MARAKPAPTHAPPRAGYTGPWRVWGPPHDRNTGRHGWISEIVPTIDGPFRKVRPRAVEWWNGEKWIATV
jgi:hypothetical protein